MKEMREKWEEKRSTHTQYTPPRYATLISLAMCEHDETWCVRALIVRISLNLKHILENVHTQVHEIELYERAGAHAV